MNTLVDVIVWCYATILRYAGVFASGGFCRVFPGERQKRCRSQTPRHDSQNSQIWWDLRFHGSVRRKCLKILQKLGYKAMTWIYSFFFQQIFDIECNITCNDMCQECHEWISVDSFAHFRSRERFLLWGSMKGSKSWRFMKILGFCEARFN